MLIPDLSELSALILAVSLATERLVVVLKTIFPRALALERVPRPGELLEEADRPRRLLVMGSAYLAALVVSLLIAGGDATVFGAPVPFYVQYGDARIAAPLLALLASGGSALWTNVVSFASAVKDIRQLERQDRREYRQERGYIVRDEPPNPQIPELPPLPR